jgi:hypothetical protein
MREKKLARDDNSAGRISAVDVKEGKEQEFFDIKATRMVAWIRLWKGVDGEVV